MAKLSNNQLTLTGKSKDQYIFTDIYALESDFPDVSGIYVFTKRKRTESGGFNHHAIYIGQADSFKNRFSSHHKEKDILKEGANAVCLMAVGKQGQRDLIEVDLIKNYNPCCNDHHVVK
jgi:excinuclease UvrABC nuclease subunit